MVDADGEDIVERHCGLDHSHHSAISLTPQDDVAIVVADQRQHPIVGKDIASIHKDGIVASDMTDALVHSIVYASVSLRNSEGDYVVVCREQFLGVSIVATIHHYGLDAGIVELAHTLQSARESFRIIESDDDYGIFSCCIHSFLCKDMMSHQREVMPPEEDGEGEHEHQG